MPQNRTRLITLAVSLAVALSADVVVSQSDARPRTAAAKPRSSTPQQQNKAEATELKGIVRDASGQTAANVTVWFVVRRDDVFDPTLETRTGDGGRFSFAIVDEAALFVPGNTITVAARDAGGRLGWRHLALSTREQPLHEIRLREGSSLSGCVLDAEGHGLGSARLTPKTFTEPRSEGVASTGNETLALWPALAEEYSVQTAPDGGFEIANVPRAVQARCTLTAGDEHVEVVIESGIAATIRLGRTGSIAGTLTLPEGAQLPVKGFQLQAWLQRDSNRPQEPSLEFNTLTVVDEQGGFSFAGLPPGRYVIRPAAQQNVPFLVAVSAPLDVKSGQLLDDVALPVTPCREVRGRVVDRDTGQGIQGVEVGVYTSEPPGGLRGLRHGQTAVTDAEGRFSTWLVPGKVQTSLRQTPAEYLPPPLQNVTTLSGPTGATLVIPDFGDNPLIELEPAVAIEGIVVDESGKAVPLAWLNIQRAPVQQRFGSWQSPPDRADRSGKFVVRQLELAGPVVLRAHTSTAATLEPVTVVPSTLDGPVALVVAEKHACRLSGQVVDRQGKPLTEAKVLITGGRQVPMGLPTGRSFLRLHSSAEIPQVAADGTFTSDALYAGDTYELQVAAPGYSARQGKTVVGQAGQVDDVGRLVLDAFVNIRGVVVDARGKAAPHAELHVAIPRGSFQPAAGLVQLHADEAGTFELPPANVEGVLRIWARSGQYTTDGPASFFPDLIDGPLRIELAEQPGLRIAARVADLQGRPVAASVEVIWQTEKSDQEFSRRAFGGFGGRGFAPVRRRNQRASLAGAATGPDGSLLIESLWPDQQYHLVATAAGYQQLESASVSGRPGETVDLGRLIMRREGLAVEGEVVDAGGQPVADATVYNSGDAHQAITVTTDAAGRFRLTGLLEGPVYVLARKPGYWPAGLRCTAGDLGQRVRLVSNQQPRPQTRPALRVNDAPLDRRDLALRLLGELWERREEYDSRNNSGRYGSATGPRSGDVVRRVADLDYSQALQWSAAEGGAFDEVVRIRAFDQIAGDDVDGAIAHAGAPGARRRLTWMARTRLNAGARDDAVRLLEAALDA
ncbi:MAG: carboxypeptidase regulatory-like domain-containing protein, partial [Pirellulales bacterium]